MRPNDYVAMFYQDARTTYLNFRVSVLIPAGAGTVLGIFSGFLFGLLAVRMHWTDPLLIAGILGALFAIAGFVFVLAWVLFMHAKVEQSLKENADRQYKPSEPVELIRKSEDGRVISRDKLPGTEDQIYAIAKLAVRGGSITIDMLQSLYGTRPRATEIRDALIERKYASWVHPEARQQGIRITPEKGIPWFKDFIERYELVNNLPPTQRKFRPMRSGYDSAHTHESRGGGSRRESNER